MKNKITIFKNRPIYQVHLSQWGIFFLGIQCPGERVLYLLEKAKSLYQKIFNSNKKDAIENIFSTNSKCLLCYNKHY